ncbi:hypothetical protein SDC9_17810 [bioreactor metagenome]|uniref:Uncharacterized protein n=1 Tax=bioreactor metagenome TaxID=1076179 RepID=A0A644SXH3_9ZZZZ|nr:hypothetical protein [Methanobrevibacter sp.]MEA4956470.1 hypothetical protein [Methanobrevibacter sp.]
MILDKKIINDKEGYFIFLEGIFAILMLFIVLMAFISFSDFQNPNYDRNIHESKLVNDIMELMISESDNYSLLTFIVLILEKNNNNLNYNTKTYISSIVENFLNKLIPHKNYILVENNILNGEIIAIKGDINDASNLSSSTRNIGKYSFTLSIF